MKKLMMVLIAGVMAASAGCANAGFYDNPLIGTAAPGFKLAQLKNGDVVSLDSLRKGGKAVLFFWATWCPHCREQLKAMNEKRAELDKLGATIQLIDVGEERLAVEKFMNAKGYDFNVLLDSDSSVAEAYGVIGVPTIVFIGPDGKIRELMNGFPDNYAEILK
jgi:peroxiredoxin